MVREMSLNRNLENPNIVWSSPQEWSHTYS